MKPLALFSVIGVAMAATAASAAPSPAASGLAFTGKGTQIYACQDTMHGYAWMLNGPDAKLYDASGEVVGRHFFGPQWEAHDGSRIKGKLLVSSASPGGPRERALARAPRRGRTRGWPLRRHQYGHAYRYRGRWNADLRLWLAAEGADRQRALFGALHLLPCRARLTMKSMATISE